MPEYEYQCVDCRRTFTLHQTIGEHANVPHPACPMCKSTNVEQLLPNTTVITSKKS
jgi:putative FmdB family regulatory protein